MLQKLQCVGEQLMLKVSVLLLLYKCYAYKYIVLLRKMLCTRNEKCDIDKNN